MFLIILALLLGFIVLHAHLQSIYWGRIKRLAERCRLRKVKLSGGWWGWTLEGQSGLLKVRIRGSLPKNHTQIVIVIPGPPDFSGVSIRPESQLTWKMREIEVGSRIFDERFFTAGPVPLVLALLNEKARSALIRAHDEITGTGGQLEIAGGMLRAEMVYDQLSHFLPLLLKVGECFAGPVDVRRRLTQNVTRDPEAGVRLQNLRLLARELPEDQGALKVLRAACSDKSPEVRLRAGMALGAKGHGVLTKLAKDPQNDAVGAKAALVLGRDLPFKSMKALFLNALGLGSLQTARACLEVLSRTGGAEAISVLVKVIEKDQGGLSVVAAQALGRMEDPAAEAAETTLIQALQSEQRDLRVAAANALGRVGSVAAVPPLQEAAERFPRDPDLHQATHQAVAEIQSRLQGASPGQLSMAGAEAGQLSLATDPAGQLSLQPGEGGQLSISGAEDPKEEP